MSTLSEAEKKRDLYLRRTYSITLSEYRQILDDQGGRCCICQKDLSGISNAVDHDHKTGVVRGILCGYCNHWNLGRHTDWELVQRMADYLRDPPAVRVLGPRATPKKSPRKRRAAKATRARRTVSSRERAAVPKDDSSMPELSTVCSVLRTGEPEPSFEAVHSRLKPT